MLISILLKVPLVSLTMSRSSSDLNTGGDYNWLDRGFKGRAPRGFKAASLGQCICSVQ